MCNRKVKIKVLTEKGELNIESCQGKRITEVLRENNLMPLHLCNGNGTCGKCKIRVVSGNLPITEADKRCLSEKELKQGVRLACKAKIGEEKISERKLHSEIGENLEHLCIEVIANAEDSMIIEGIEKTKSTESVIIGREKNEITISEKEKNKSTTTVIKGMEQTKSIEQSDYLVAIDIGTTTIAMALVNRLTGEICDTYTSLNHQRRFGADVLSRIAAANNGKAEELKRTIERDLWSGICQLAQTKISQIIISGNPAMIHLLMGYSCEALGKYPFRSEHLGSISCHLADCIVFETNQEEFKGNDTSIVEKELYEQSKNIPVLILPAIAAFVGGDVVADLLVCPGFETEELSLLIDLGTNGEMVLGNKDKLLATSTAAGPAFEGGNITCGTASIPGSISRVKIENRRAVVKTIQNKFPPVGICGTGLVSAVTELLENSLMDEQGGLKPPYQKSGYPLWTFEYGEKIALYQQDIREFQMAKSAIRAGIEILMEEFGCKSEEIQHVYLAGGFGVHLAEKDAIITGILPKNFRGKIEVIGNGALKGAVLAGFERGREEQNRFSESVACSVNKRMEEIVNKSCSISLADKSKFQEKYVEYMNFFQKKKKMN